MQRDSSSKVQKEDRALAASSAHPFSVGTGQGRRQELAIYAGGHECGQECQNTCHQERHRVVAQGVAGHAAEIGGQGRADLVREEDSPKDRANVHPAEPIGDEGDGRRNGGDVVEAEEDREGGESREVRHERQEEQRKPA
jgi:hypothetical protein